MVEFNTTLKKHIEKIHTEARTILLCKSIFHFIGATFYGIDAKYLDPKEYEKWCRINKAPVMSLAVTNGKIIVYRISEKTTTSEYIFITCHEILHIICQHAVRCGGRIKEIWNLAADHVINRLLKELCNTTSLITEPKGLFYIDELDNAKYKESTVEFVYDWIMSHKERFEIKKITQNEDGEIIEEKDIFNKEDLLKNNKSNNKNIKATGSSSPNGKSSGTKSTDEDENTGASSNAGNEGTANNVNLSDLSQNDDQQGNNNEPQEKDSITNNKRNGKTYSFLKILDKKNNTVSICSLDTDISDIAKLSNDKIEDIVKHLDVVRQQIKGVWDNVLNKGNMPGAFIEFIDDLFTIEIPWTQLLLNALLFPIQNQNKYSWMSPNIIYPPTPACRRNKRQTIRPRLMGKKDGKSLYTLVACIDSSGSISSEDLKKFISVLRDTHTYFKSLIILIHDVLIQDTIVINNFFSEEQLFEKIKDGIKGRGGTSHQHVFKTLQDDYIPEMKVSSIVFLTDFCSDVESIYQNYEFMNQYETIWIVNRKIESNIPCPMKIITLK